VTASLRGEALLERVTEQALALKALKHTLRREVQQELARRISKEQMALDLSIRLAFEAGASKAAIGRAMGTTDPGAPRRSLDRTEALSSSLAEPSCPSDERFKLLDDSKILVTLSGTPLEQACEAEGWTVGEAKSLSLDSMVVKFLTGQQGNNYIGFDTSQDWMPDYGRRHPVAAWVGRSGEAEILAWKETL
jgi:hypothetical protein